jgi:hypothetical protein
MATNFFFNNFAASGEQQLIESLVVESIKIYGHDTYYLPRTRVNTDHILGEDSYSQFNSFHLTDLYIKNVEGFQGQGDFLSKFNLEIRDQVTLTMARKTFGEDVGAFSGRDRPLEGDIIFLPLNNKFFEIKFVEHEAIFYQLGSLQTYDLVCELFEFSNEQFNTGLDFIDANYDSRSTDLSDYNILYEDGLFMLTEDGFEMILDDFYLERIDPISDNVQFQDEGDTILDFTEIDPFSEGVY